MQNLPEDDIDPMDEAKEAIEYEICFGHPRRFES